MMGSSHRSRSIEIVAPVAFYGLAPGANRIGLTQMLVDHRFNTFVHDPIVIDRAMK